MGLFDIPAPLFGAIDGLLGFLPAYARLLLWAAITGALSMFFYWLCSAQEKVEGAKRRAIKGRKEMAAYQGTEFGEMWPLAKESLAASGKHFIVVLVPAVLSSLPALTLIVWVSGQFSYTLPATGTDVAIQSTPAAAAERLQPLVIKEDGPAITWPPSDDKFTVSTLDNIELIELPLQAAVPVVHQRKWWNSLIANPNGYLPDDTGIEEIHFELLPIEFIQFGPAWARTWELSYFLLLILVSLGIKVAFKIH
jgi:hypothetical protein